MKIKTLLMGSKGMTYESDVIHAFELKGEMFAAHLGHNKLMPTLVLTHIETGFPVRICKLDPNAEVDATLATKYVTKFHDSLVDFSPESREKINEIPPIID